MLISTNILVLAGILFLPKNGFNLGGVQFTFLSTEDFVPTETIKTPKIRDILPAFNVADALNDTSILVATDDVSDVSEMTFIEATEEGKGLFKDFFQQMLSARKSKKVVRVLHYGDSQIEGDRVTSVIRERLQKEYGGAGVGLLPISEPSHSRMSVAMEHSNNWVRKQVFGANKLKLDNKLYGLLGFTHFVQRDSGKTEDSLTAGMKFSAKSNFFKRTAQSRKVSFVYSAKGNVKVVLNGKEHQLDSNQFPTVKTISFPEDQKVFDIQMSAMDSFSVFGCALDGESGVAVDNIPIRGSSGLDFTNIDRDHLRSQYSKLNIGLIIYQFGVNVVPHVVDDYGFYKRGMMVQLKRLKSLNPGVPILVIGTSDMSRKEGSNYVSYPNVEQIRDAQKEAALEAGCGFWDLYEVMGGANSMPVWVFADPPLAQKDFIHFNPRGANIVGQKLYEAINQLKEEMLGTI